MKDPARVLPPAACHNCGEWLKPDEWYDCQACIDAIGWSYRKYDARTNKALVIQRCTPWDKTMDDERRMRVDRSDGDMCMADGSICHYDTASERIKLERINSVHVGADLRPRMDEHNNFTR